MTQAINTLFVTALGLERHELRKHFEPIKTAQVADVDVDLGSIRGKNSDLKVGIIEVGPGNVDAGHLTTRVVTELQPKNVIVVGVAGGRKDVEIGDVVVASKVYWIEAGKDGRLEAPRPDFGPVSIALVQQARTLAAGDQWQSRAKPPGSGRRANGAQSIAVVKPIAACEKVIASSSSGLAKLIVDGYSDAVAIEMESFGVMRAVHASEIRGVVVRGISDLLDNKANADKEGGQPIAASNAAAFAVELVVAAGSSQKMDTVAPRGEWFHRLHQVACELYPEGPTDSRIWERSGGDVSRLQLQSQGLAAWWDALSLLARGGGGQSITLPGLLAVMRQDWPNNQSLKSLAEIGGTLL